MSLPDENDTPKLSLTKVLTFEIDWCIALQDKFSFSCGGSGGKGSERRERERVRWKVGRE